jgi:hypothetical protein
MSGFNVVDGGRARQRSAKRLIVGDGEKSFFFCGAKRRFWPKATDFAPQRNVRFQGCSDRRGDHARNVETA